LREDQNSVEEPEQTARGLQPPAHPRPSEESGEDAAADERTSPFPYAEKFDEWVADETVAPDAGQQQARTGRGRGRPR
jgi:hypothetical protein